MKTPSKTVARNIKNFRENLGLSQPTFAILVGVVPNAIAKWEQCERGPTGENLKKLALAVQRPIDDLYLDDPPQREIIPPAFAVVTILPDIDEDLLDQAMVMIRGINRQHAERHRTSPALTGGGRLLDAPAAHKARSPQSPAFSEDRPSRHTHGHRRKKPSP